MRLLAITPGDNRDLRPWIAAMAEAGLREVLVREPHGDAAHLVQSLGDLGIQLILHEKTPGALQTHLPVHLAAVSLHTPDRPFGQSCHTREELDAAFARGATYALLSPVWSPTSKTNDREPLGLERFLDWAGTRPVLALGGVTPERFAQLPHGAAVLGDLWRATPSDSANRVRAYQNWNSSS